MRDVFTYASLVRASHGWAARAGYSAPGSHTGGTAISTEARTEAAAPVDLSGVAALRSVLRIRPFRRLWLVLSVASFGDWLGLLATALFASQQVEGSVAQGG